MQCKESFTGETFLERKTNFSVPLEMSATREVKVLNVEHKSMSVCGRHNKDVL